MSHKIRVGLVFGGRSCEHEVSLSSARSVYAAIDRTQYDLTLIHIAKNGEWRLPADAAAAPRLAGEGSGADSGTGTGTGAGVGAREEAGAGTGTRPGAGTEGGTGAGTGAGEASADPTRTESGGPPPILTGQGGDDALPILVGYPDGGRLLARRADGAGPLAPESASRSPSGAGSPDAAGGDERAVAAGNEAAGTATSLDVVFPLLHGPFGEDGTVQGLLELAGVPYVGAGVLGSAAAMDKAMMKRAFRAEGLPVMEYMVVRRSDWRRDPDRVRAEAEARLGYPMFVKPANLGSSVGVNRIDDAGAFSRLVDDSAAYDTKVLIEAAALDCHEIECAVLGNDDPKASVVGEIVPSREYYDYDAKYVDDASELVIPAPLPPETAREGSGSSRSPRSARWTPAGSRGSTSSSSGGLRRRVFVNEVNTMPGFTPISMYPKLWEASGIPYSELIDRLIRLAIEEHRDRATCAPSCRAGAEPAASCEARTRRAPARGVRARPSRRVDDPTKRPRRTAVVPRLAQPAIEGRRERRGGRAVRQPSQLPDEAPEADRGGAAARATRHRGAPRPARRVRGPRALPSYPTKRPRRTAVVPQPARPAIDRGGAAGRRERRGGRAVRQPSQLPDEPPEAHRGGAATRPARHRGASRTARVRGPPAPPIRRSARGGPRWCRGSRGARA